MKNQYFYFILIFCFLLGISLDVRSMDNDGGEELMIITSKTGEVVCSFEVPKKYVNKEGSLLVPLEIRVHQQNKVFFYTTQILDLDNLPLLMSGDYIITIKIGVLIKTCMVQN